MAATVLIVAILLVLVIPLGFTVGALADNTENIVAWVGSLNKYTLPLPPEWLSKIPLAGSKLAAKWQELSAEGPGALTARFAPYGGRFVHWFGAQLGSIGAMILQFLITVIICAVLYMKGEAAARGVRKFAVRLAGSQGDRAVLLAGSSVRGVAMGVVGTAIIQTLIAGTGLVLASIPGALLISAAILILCLAQVGPVLIAIPALIWKFSTGPKLSAVVLLAFMLVACTIDNVIRPILIKKGANLPLLLIFSGVIGGMISLGIMGIFVGPVILAVTYTLLADWVENRSAPVPEEPARAVAVERAVASSG